MRTSTPRSAASCKRVEQRCIGDEIRARDPKPVAGRIDRVHEEQAARFEHVGGVGGEAERGFVCVRGGEWRPIELGYVASGPIPVFEKGELNRLHDRAADFDHACRARGQASGDGPCIRRRR